MRANRCTSNISHQPTGHLKNTGQSRLTDVFTLLQVALMPRSPIADLRHPP